jgi:hypothetical protein
MIDPTTARELVGLILHVEERLTRLLTSGWRQASPEAADLQQEAVALSEVGLPALAARVAAVAAATDASSALPAIALATSACQLMRTRLLVSEPPDGWQPIQPPRARTSRAPSTGDTLLPIARLQIDDQDVWACAWLARNQVILLESPLPLPPETPDDRSASDGLLSRVQQRLRAALSAVGDDVPASFWLRHRLSGRLQWQARLPLGVSGEIAVCTLDDAEWQEDTEGLEQDQVRAFRSALASNSLKDGTALNWSISSVRAMELDRRDAAAYVWLDPTTAAAFHEMASPDMTALVMVTDNVIVPLAALRPGEHLRKPRIVHLLPGLPTDTLDAPVRRWRSVSDALVLTAAPSILASATLTWLPPSMEDARARAAKDSSGDDCCRLQRHDQPQPR